MRNYHKTFFSLAVLAVLVAVGCHSSTKDTGAAVTQSGKVAHMMAMQNDSAAAASTKQKAGSELWAENCTRCHNARPPQYYSDVTWDIIVHHMRLRADLTGEEARAVAEFLKAAN
jgi:hypothetical protein